MRLHTRHIENPWKSCYIYSMQPTHYSPVGLLRWKKLIITQLVRKEECVVAKLMFMHFFLHFLQVCIFHPCFPFLSLHVQIQCYFCQTEPIILLNILDIQKDKCQESKKKCTLLFCFNFCSNLIILRPSFIFTKSFMPFYFSRYH